MSVVYDFFKVMWSTRWGSGHPLFSERKVDQSRHPVEGGGDKYSHFVSVYECSSIRVTCTLWMRSNNLLVQYVSAAGEQWDFYARHDIEKESTDVFRLNGATALAEDVTALRLVL
jgi:hypothetical protein